MKSLLITTICATAIIAVLSLTGCDDTIAADKPASALDKLCRVQFRRDALGAAANLPISPMTAGINGADTAISCTYKRTSDDWVIVERGGKVLWIPKSVILLIEFAP